MGSTYGIIFKYSTTPLADPYTSGTILGTVLNSGLTGGGTTATLSTSLSIAGTYYLYAILTPDPSDITCRPFKNNSIIIIENATVNAVANQIVCNGSPTSTINFSGNPSGVFFDWTNNTPSIGLAANGSGSIASFTAVNTGNAPITATITVTPKLTVSGVTCSGTPTTFTITVNPTPTVNTIPNQSICNGFPTLAVNFTGNVTSTVYNWTNNTPAIGLASSGTGNIPSFIAINTGTLPIVATITVTPSYTNGGLTCTGAPKTFTITVNPQPIAIITSSSDSLCPGESGTLIASGGNTYLWNTGATTSSISVMVTVNTSFSVTVTSSAGCSSVATKTIFAKPLTSCIPPSFSNYVVKGLHSSPQFTDPCTCIGNGLFSEEVVVTDFPGRNWFINNTTTNPSTLLDPATLLPFADGTPLIPVIPVPARTDGRIYYVLSGVHKDGIGYQAFFRSTTFPGQIFPTATTPLSNKCYYPVFNGFVEDYTYCRSSLPIGLSSTINGKIGAGNFTISPVPPGVTNPITSVPAGIPAGTYTISYNPKVSIPPVSGDDSTGIACTISKLLKIVNTPAQLTCNDLLNVSLDTTCQALINADMILEGSYGCYDDYSVVLKLGNQTVPNPITSFYSGKTLTAYVYHKF